MKHTATPPQGSRPIRTRKRLDRAYTYHDADGRELFQHVRWITNDERGKDFSYRWRLHPRALWVWKKPNVKTAGYDADHYVWNLPAVLAAIRAGEPVWWPEGERDAGELVKAGVTATSHHGGACHVSAEQCEWLRGAAGAVLLVDRDPAGAACGLLRWRGLVEHAKVPPGRIRVLRARKGKDVADHLAAGYGLADFVPVSLTTLRGKAAQYTPKTAARSGYAYVGRAL